MLGIVGNYHCMQFQGKLMSRIWENSKKPSFGPDFGPFGPNLGLFFSFFCFSKIWLRQSHHGQLSSCTISEKPNNPIIRNFSDRQTDESDFIGRCSTNVERPTKKGKKKTKNDENRRISWLENFVSTMQMDYITFGGKN